MSHDDFHVLQSVLDELDRERNKRAEVEMELYALRNKLETSYGIMEPIESDNRNLLYAEEEKDDSPLVISHIMNMLFKEHDSKNIPKRSLSSLLKKFFGDLYDSMMNYAERNTETLKHREKLIKDSIQTVLRALDKTPSSHILRYDYPIESIKTVLENVAQDFCVRLEGDRCACNDENDNFFRLTTEINGLKDLLNTIVSDNNAVLRSSQNERGTLPLFVTRLLEIMPWDDRIESYISGYEKVHQWQCFDPRNHSWSDRIRLFPIKFSSLPIHKMNTQEELIVPNKEPNQLTSPLKGIQHAFDALGLSGRLLTNMTCDRILDLTNGYSLPQRGTWEWIGNWTIDGSATTSNSEDIGWNYATDIQTLINGGGSTELENSNEISFRRRTWYRLRVLVAYPGVSRGTEQMLKMHAHNAKLTLAVAKLQDQVNSMQNKLIEKDEELEKALIESKEHFEIIQKFVNEKKSSLDTSDSPKNIEIDPDSRHRKALLCLNDNEHDALNDLIGSCTASINARINEVPLDMNSHESPSFDKGLIHGARKLQIHAENFIGTATSA
jgi:hypothetical protein